MPLPWRLVVKKGTKIFSRCSARNAGAVVGNGDCDAAVRLPVGRQSDLSGRSIAQSLEQHYAPD